MPCYLRLSHCRRTPVTMVLVAKPTPRLAPSINETSPARASTRASTSARTASPALPPNR